MKLLEIDKVRIFPLELTTYVLLSTIKPVTASTLTSAYESLEELYTIK